MSLLRISFRALSGRLIKPTTSLRYSSTTSPIGATISRVAQEEGGTTKGSASATMQSQTTRQRNAEQASAEVGDKLNTAPETVTSEDASYVQSREARATGIAHPAGGVAQAAMQQAAVNKGAKGASSVRFDPAARSQADKEQNYLNVAREVKAKMETDPGSVTKEEADRLHSREHRAFGNTEKGGLAAHAQSRASKATKERSG